MRNAPIRALPAPRTLHNLAPLFDSRPAPRGGWQADLYLLARQRLNRAGVNLIFGGDRCTYTEEEAFFSYRRDGVTGRMATLIWMEETR